MGERAVRVDRVLSVAERRALRTAPGERPDPDDVAWLEARGFVFVKAASVGWHGQYAATDWWYERTSTPPAPPRPIYRRK
jgi:hypothetical protein